MIYTDLAMSFGWSWEYIDEFVTVPRLFEISDAWRTNPPLHRAFSGFLKALGGDRSAASSSQRGASPEHVQDSGADLMRDLAAAGVGIQTGGLPPALMAMLEQEKV